MFFFIEDGICLCFYIVSCDVECEENRIKMYIKRNFDGILILKYVDSGGKLEFVNII